MRRLVVSLLTLAAIATTGGYAGGLFTTQQDAEQACIICRAVRHTGTAYGFHYDHIEGVPFTQWFLDKVDPLHGGPGRHVHKWYKSTCSLNADSSQLALDCTYVPPVLQVRPEMELAALLHIPGRDDRAALINSLSTSNRTLNGHRVQTLVQYYFVEQYRSGWKRWWRKHAAEFGLVSGTGG